MRIRVRIDEATKAEVYRGAEYQANKFNTFMHYYYLGGIGEAAVMLHSGLKYKFKEIERGGDGGIDLPGIQVKTRDWYGDNLELLVKKKDKCLSNPDVKTFVFCVSLKRENYDYAYILGEISKEKFMEVCKVSKRFPDSYYVTEDVLDLYEPDTLLQNTAR